MAKMNICQAFPTTVKDPFESDVESSDEESSDNESVGSFFDDQSKESSFAGDDISEFFDDSFADESSFVSHGIPLNSSSASLGCGSICSIESALPTSLTSNNNGSQSSLESAFLSHNNYNNKDGGSREDFGSDDESDYVVAVNMFPVKQTSRKSLKRSGNRSPSENSLNDSCHSIKDILAIDSINEDAETTNTSAVEYQFDDNGDVMVKEMNSLLSKIVQSTQTMEMGAASASGDNSQSGAGLKKSHRSSSKKCSKMNNPLLSKYLNRKKASSKASSSTTDSGGGVISSILGSSDSLQHIKGSKNKRVVGTKAHAVRKHDAVEKKTLVLQHDGKGDDEFVDFSMPVKDICEDIKPPAHQPRKTRAGPACATMKKRATGKKRATLSSSSKKVDDPLIQRYMSLRNKSSTGSNVAKAPTGSSGVAGMVACDSLNHVAGKGSRVVKTRTRGIATAF